MKAAETIYSKPPVAPPPKKPQQQIRVYHIMDNDIKFNEEMPTKKGWYLVKDETGEISVVKLKENSTTKNLYFKSGIVGSVILKYWLEEKHCVYLWAGPFDKLDY